MKDYSKLKMYSVLLNEYTRKCISISTKIGVETSDEEPYKYLLTQVLHINGSLSSISLLLRSVEKEPHHLNQINLLLRNLITNTTLTFYAIFESLDHGEESDNELLKNIDRINFDHLKNLRGTLNQHNEYCKGKNQSFLKKVENEIKILKSKNGNIEKETIRLSDAFKKIIEKKEDDDFKYEFCFLFDRWTLYSKIEHPGYFSLDIFNLQFNEKEQLESIKDLFYITKFVISKQLFYLSFWKDEDLNELKECYNKLLETKIK